MLREDGKVAWIRRSDPHRQEIASAVLRPVFDRTLDVDSPEFHLRAAQTLREERLLEAAFLLLARGLSIAPDNPELQAAMAETQDLLANVPGA
jgi:hypothetical protein